MLTTGGSAPHSPYRRGHLLCTVQRLQLRCGPQGGHFLAAQVLLGGHPAAACALTGRPLIGCGSGGGDGGQRTGPKMFDGQKLAKKNASSIVFSRTPSSQWFADMLFSCDLLGH